MTIGKVFNVYPEANMVDVLLFDGSRLRNVQLMVPYASSSAGILNIPLPKYDESLDDKDFPLELAKQTEVDVFVVIAFLGGEITRPIALGFLFPEENQVLCGRADNAGNTNGGMYLFKHISNVYKMIDKDGQIEISHPSGLFIKIGNNTTKTTINNWDKDIRPFKSGNPLSDEDELSEAPYIYLSHPSGNTISIDPNGNVTENIEGDVTRTIKGGVTETIDGDFTRTVKGDLNDTIEGAVTEESTGNWDRTSNGIMNDKATQINHDSV